MKQITPGTELIHVAIDAPQYSALGSTLSYLCEHKLTPGSLVRIPLGKRELTGIVWDEAGVERETSKDYELRSVLESLDPLPALPATWLALVSFAAKYYQRNIGELAMGALPPDLRRLDKLQLARRIKRLEKSLTQPVQFDVQPRPALSLSAEQSLALQAIAQLPLGSTALLHGATGSGKTEVYLREVERVIAAGGQALVMVPEINLTPQLLGQFEQRFGGRRIVAMHSRLSTAQRLQHWMMALLGHADVVLGTRLAIFTPLPRLQLIVVDEEHEASYKQQEGARYSARDLAVIYARLAGVKTLLGSATPSLETWFNTQARSPGSAPRYAYIGMPTRMGDAAMPRVRLIDMTLEKKRRALSATAPLLSAPLLQALQERIAHGEQSLVLLNRRGYAPVLQCADCGWRSQCPHCSAWRVFHKHDRSLRCHHCGWSERVPRACPDCGNLDIHAVGLGTERLEEQLSTALPGARFSRIDGDTTKLKGALEEQLQRVHSGEVDILIGTQMIAKGHDFRRMTLVAALNPDAALFSHDFRAPERLFALLMQAAGRAGRDATHVRRSEMLVQTGFPTHPLYAALQADDYQRFADVQLQERRNAGLPPYAHLALLRAQARSQEAAMGFLMAAASAARALPELQGITLYPPVPAAMPKVANMERVQLLVEAPQRPALQAFLKVWQAQLQRIAQDGTQARVLRWTLDVDPLEI